MLHGEPKYMYLTMTMLKMCYDDDTYCLVDLIYAITNPTEHTNTSETMFKY